MNALDDPERPLPALTLTIQTPGAPTVQLSYAPDRPIHQTAVTLLDQLSDTRAWFFDDVVADAFVFLLHYVRARRQWPAELRMRFVRREHTDEPHITLRVPDPEDRDDDDRP
jgi:hypothetical protein